MLSATMADMEPTTPLIVLCTCPDSRIADEIARHLVHNQLAACVKALPNVQSVYRWQGQIEQASEVQLLIKTCAAHLPKLYAAITALHPYDVPEIVATNIVAGLPAYLDWMQAQMDTGH